jgi:hypothetical protein
MCYHRMCEPPCHGHTKDHRYASSGWPVLAQKCKYYTFQFGIVSFRKNITHFETKICSPSQENLRHLWILRVYPRVHKSPPLVSVLYHVKAVHTILFYSFNINFNIIIPSKTRFSQWAIPLKEENISEDSRCRTEMQPQTSRMWTNECRSFHFECKCL